MPLRTHTLASLAADTPLLAPYRNLRAEAVRERELQGLHDVFIAESELTVRQLLASPCGVQSLLTTPAQLEKLLPALHTRAHVSPNEQIEVLLASEVQLHEVVGFAFHRGVLAAGLRPPTPSLATLLACDTLTIVEGVSNYDNIGAMFRNVACLAGAVQGSQPGVILGPGCCDPLYRKAIRVSIGHALSIPFATANDLLGAGRRDTPASTVWPGVLHRLREAGWRVLALTPAGDTALSDERTARTPNTKIALLLGAEGPGLSPPALEAASARVAIPMREGVDSLNVATALAVAWSWLR
jgi:tRNA G18 (ribose-2'-O)-methylase SpoU